MKPPSLSADPVLAAWTRPGLALLLLAALACGGNGGPAAIDGTLPAPPAISVPTTSALGFPVQASVLNGGYALSYRWTLSAGTFQGGAATASGPKVTFTPATPGVITVSCVAIKGNALLSQPASQTVTVGAPASTGGSFHSAGSLLQARQGFAAAALPNSTILVAGGSATLGGSALASAEIYSPATQISTATPSPMTAARVGPATATLGSGTQILISGGTGATGSLASGELFDSVQMLFRATGAMANARSGSTATYLITPPAVLIAGGSTTAGNPVPALELFTPVTGLFSSSGTVPVPLAPGATATLLPTGKVLLVSHGYAGSAWVPFAALYDPGTGLATPTAKPPGFPREGHQALLLGGKVLILGGDGGNGPLQTAEWYDPATGLFAPSATDMASPRAYFGAAVLPGTQAVLLLGGTADGSTALATAERFDSVAGTSNPTGALGAARIQPFVTASNGQILVLGGYDSSGQAVAPVEAYF